MIVNEVFCQGGQIGLGSDPYGLGSLRTTMIQQTVRGKDEKDDGSDDGSDDSLGGLGEGLCE